MHAAELIQLLFQLKTLTHYLYLTTHVSFETKIHKATLLTLAQAKVCMISP